MTDKSETPEPEKSQAGKPPGTGASGVILGIDPGSLHTGYGLIEASGQTVRMIACGTVSPSPGWPLPERLALIHRAVLDLVREFKPAAMALEDIFVYKNVRGTITLAQARAAAILAASLSAVPVFEYSPTLVKNVVAGSGKAGKGQVAFMVSRILNITAAMEPDTSDALAVAICHAGQARLDLSQRNTAAAKQNRSSSWRNMSVADLENLGFKFEKN
jgi:crossover junction endodeoxyribonuclease RuvC